MADAIVYLGLDDTDRLDEGGTGRLARTLARRLRTVVGSGRLLGVSRHQLLEDPRILMTRRNRGSCVVMRVGRNAVEDEQGRRLDTDERVDTGGRIRPALRGGRRALLVRRAENGLWQAVKPGREGA